MLFFYQSTFLTKHQQKYPKTKKQNKNPQPTQIKTEI